MVTHCIQRFGEDVVQAVVGATIRVHHSARVESALGFFLFMKRKRIGINFEVNSHGRWPQHIPKLVR